MWPLSSAAKQRHKVECMQTSVSDSSCRWLHWDSNSRARAQIQYRLPSVGAFTAQSLLLMSFPSELMCPLLFYKYFKPFSSLPLSSFPLYYLTALSKQKEEDKQNYERQFVVQNVGTTKINRKEKRMTPN